MSSKKVKGLRLTLGGAPDSPHQIPGLAGYYLPSRVTPVGGPGETPLEVAEEFAGRKEPSVELVEISEAQADKEREFQAELVVRGRHGVLDLRSKAKGAEVAQVKDELAAIGGGEV